VFPLLYVARACSFDGRASSFPYRSGVHTHMAGNSFEWDDCVLIKFGTGKAVTLPVERVDGRTFFHLVKSSSPVRHLLQSKCDHDTTTKQARVLHKIYNTNIVERITALRDDQFKSMLTTDHVPEYLRNRYGNKRMRAGVLGLPQVFEVEAPSVDQVAGVTMALLGTKPKSKLMAELTVANLDYLASVVEQQNSSGHILKQHPRTHVDAPEGTSVPGVTIAHSREAYLAKFKDNDGVVHTKLAFWKKVGKNSALQEASEWIQSWADGDESVSHDNADIAAEDGSNNEGVVTSSVA
jgi:hypothetical protein